MTAGTGNPKIGRVSLQGTPPARWRRKCVAHMTGYSPKVQKKRDGSIRERRNDQGLRQGVKQQGYPDSNLTESGSPPLDEVSSDGSIATTPTNSASAPPRAYKPGPCPFDLATFPLGRPRRCRSLSRCLAIWPNSYLAST
jgi:hypothetical protein